MVLKTEESDSGELGGLVHPLIYGGHDYRYKSNHCDRNYKFIH